jgi:hypothetical protein|tara:strand:+ start:98 stop:325 length:228 start_codon:yes stop_codon:yes gene_type:complete
MTWKIRKYPAISADTYLRLIFLGGFSADLGLEKKFNDFHSMILPINTGSSTRPESHQVVRQTPFLCALFCIQVFQ